MALLGILLAKLLLDRAQLLAQPSSPPPVRIYNAAA